MTRFLFFSLLVLPGYFSAAQDFSNKGKDFWLCFPSHVPNERLGTIYYAKMSLFITADKASSGTVSIQGIFNTSFTVASGQVTEIDIPYSAAHISPAEAGNVIRKGIHVQVDKGKPAVVVYSQIYAGFRSAASLILPSPVLGKKYFSMNAPQQSISGSKSQFVVVAVDTNTTVEIIPVRDGVKGAAFTITLPLPGDLYEFQDAKDLTGSIIESVAKNTEGCKRIAVFSGSSAINIISNNPCTGEDSYDPLYQQLYPVSAWGKTYGFMPFENYNNGCPYRIIAAENNTAVSINGITVATLNEGQCYPDKNLFGITQTKAVLIKADKPVCVAQYAQRSGCSGAVPPPGQGYGDPDMVILNPLEQKVNNITMFSSQKENIYAESKFVNVLIQSQATASFTINGVKPNVTWMPVLPSGSGYACSRIKLETNQSSFTLNADSGFNAIAYGFGDFESYAYSAGTNVKDLYRALKIENEFGVADVPIACKNGKFKITVTLPYQPSRIKFLFNGLFPDETITNPVAVETTQVNGRTVYRYRLDQSYLSDTTGTFPITVVAENATFNSCNNGTDEIDFDLEIVESPKVDWTFASKGCVNEQIIFTDQSDGRGRELKKWLWNFGDGSESINASPAHVYTMGNNYKVRHWAVTDIGCGTDTLEKIVSITDVPSAKFNVSPILCEDSKTELINESVISGSGSIAQYQWNFGDDYLLNKTDNAPAEHFYNAPGNYQASLQVISSSGCQSEVFTKEITIHAKPVASFQIPIFCLPAGTGKFINESGISDGSGEYLNYAWDFGDGSGDVNKDPIHQYKDKGPYTVKLTATSSKGCTDDSSAIVSSIYPFFKIDAIVPAENCLGEKSGITVMTTADNQKLGTIYWTEGAEASFLKTNIDDAATKFYKTFDFTTPGDHSIKLFGEIENTGCYTDTLIKTIYINRLPEAGFEITAPLCDQKPVAFIDTSKSQDGKVIKWEWKTSDGKSSYQQNPSFSFSKGTHIVNLKIETDKGCIAEAQSQALVVKDVPLPDFEMSSVCTKDVNARFINKSTIAEGAEADFIYSWNFNDVNATVNNPNTSTDKDPAHHFITAGIYEIRLSVLSKDGCFADTIKKFMVNGSNPVAGFTIDQSNTLCSNKELPLKDASGIDFGNIIKAEIYWDYNNDPLIKTIDTLPLPGKTYSHKYPDTKGTDKTYSIKYIVYSGLQCLSEFNQTITVKPIPDIEFGVLQGVCEEVPVFNITAKEKNDIGGAGIFSGNGISADGLFDPDKAGPGLHRLTYTFVTTAGCKSAKGQTIEVFPTPFADAGQDKIIEKGDVVILDGSARGNNVQYEWSPPINIDNVNIAVPKVSPVEDISYRLSVISSDGCKASDEVEIKVLKELFIPNAFTPNNDGKNDSWNIPNLRYYPECTVQIFNRYGQKIFYSEGYQRPWDGTLKGTALPTGTYVWEIRLRKSRKPLSGFVVLIR